MTGLRARGRRGDISTGAVVSGVLFLLAAAGVAFYFLYFKHTVGVPTLVGKTWADAEREGRKLGFKVKRQNVGAESGNPGYVSIQDPPAGSRAKPGSVLVLSVPGGAHLVVVPRILGFSASAARKIVERVELEFTEQGQRPDLQLPAGRVVRQDPQPGIQVVKRSSVHVEISSGSKLRRVPDLITRSLKEAQAIGSDHGFTVEKTGEEYRPPPFREDDVLLQDPPPGSAVDPTVTIINVAVRSQSKDRAPTVIGLKLGDARNWIGKSKMGITLSVDEGEDVPGTVIVRQDPPPGASYAGGISIATTSKVTVPAFEGSTLQEAYSMAGRAGLQLTLKESPEDAPAGIVVKQSIPAGEAVDAAGKLTVELLIPRITARNLGISAPSPSPTKKRAQAPSPSENQK